MSQSPVIFQDGRRATWTSQALIASLNRSKPEGLGCDDGWKRVVASLQDTPAHDLDTHY